MVECADEVIAAFRDVHTQFNIPDYMGWEAEDRKFIQTQIEKVLTYIKSGHLVHVIRSIGELVADVDCRFVHVLDDVFAKLGIDDIDAMYARLGEK